VNWLAKDITLLLSSCDKWDFAGEGDVENEGELAGCAGAALL
jgi:hypothetical protein